MNRLRRVDTSIKNRQKVQDRREQLAAAAIRVFLKKGFHDSTVRDIGAAAGLTQGTIYNYVRSKDDILYLVCDQVIEAYQQAVRRAIDNVSGSAARLEATIRAIVRTMYEHQDHILLIYHESHALDRGSLRAILSRVEAFNAFIAEILDDAIGDSRLAVTNRTLAVNIVTFLPTIVALRRWDLKDKVGFEELLEGVASFIVRGLGLPAEPARRPGRAGAIRLVKRS